MDFFSFFPMDFPPPETKKNEGRVLDATMQRMKISPLTEELVKVA